MPEFEFSDTGRAPALLASGDAFDPKHIVIFDDLMMMVVDEFQNDGDYKKRMELRREW